MPPGPSCNRPQYLYTGSCDKGPGQPSLLWSRAREPACASYIYPKGAGAAARWARGRTRRETPMPIVTVALVAALIAAWSTPSHAVTDGEVRQVVAREIKDVLPSDRIGGAAVAVRIDGRTLFFNFGWADREAR